MIINNIAKEITIEFEEKKSKFIGYIKPVDTVKDAENFIATIKKMHPSATHNVPLYRVIENGQEHLKYNDDGEPGGTAGKPMADIAIVQNVYNFVLVATRYFGGVKLGAGGLIRMYAKTAKLAIAAAEIIPPSNKITAKLLFSYDLTSKINEFLSRHSITVRDEIYTETVSLTIEADAGLRDEINSLYNVKVTFL